ncbi:Gfo/Idh/MocA family protein [Zavarzinella formosa]|uniref:Gfo/Idh/MocA family protein n=1 Tax=Zavarzinella formosa TaxID=360055 RepID=UPI0002DEFCC8|nr:Gfo/Idh/MocA family oxidoreductase [Zavarzinella formosa]
MGLNRRTFLQTAAAGGVTYFLPEFPTLRAAETPSPSSQIRFAAIGVGGQGKGNLAAHAKNCVAVCDVDSTHLAAAVAQVEKASGKAPEGVADYRKILERKDVDAVIVSTPDHWHAKITIDACNAGKDVYCEKPLTLTIVEGRKIVEAARKNKRIVQTGSQQRSDAKFRLACELVRSGRLGKISEVKVGIPGVNFKGPAVADAMPPAELDYDRWLGPAPQRPYNEKRVHYLFRFFWDYSGGQLTNFGAHHLDIMQWALGMDESGPSTVDAKARYHKDGWYEVPEWCEILYTYANGVKVTCGMAEKGGCTFIGEKGSIYVTRGKIESTPGDIIKEPLKEADVHLYASNNHHQNWVECMRSRKLPICDAEIGHRSATVCHLGNIAARLQKKITWDPVKEQIVGDAKANAMIERPYREPWKLS